jgi:hypothetical protein
MPCPPHHPRSDDGVGLAAPQVGVNVRMMVFNESGKKGSAQEVVLINPRIVSDSGDERVFEEGCLSFPAIYADVVVSSRRDSASPPYHTYICPREHARTHTRFSSTHPQLNPPPPCAASFSH